MNKDIDYKWKPSGITGLEDTALDVVCSISHCSVIAGPGAGKTELLAQRAVYLLDTGRCHTPHRILAISFKKDAAKNLKDRVKQRCSKQHANRFDSYTFDAFAKLLLDRFINVLPNEHQPSKNYIIKENNINSEINKHIKKASLCNILSDKKNYSQWGFKKHWQTIIEETPSQLSFTIIQRLAEFILFSNQYIKNGLISTYTHVFLDEFQDTTYAQYDFIKQAFLNQPSIITAVGDPKQRIMGWASALPDAFGNFETDFKASRKELNYNYRSSPELVSKQNLITKNLLSDKGIISNVKSQSKKEIIGNSSEFWLYKNNEEQIRGIANFISQEIQQKNLTHKDFVLLVKQKPENYIKNLTKIFKGYKLTLFNASKFQGLLGEELSILIILHLRLYNNNFNDERNCLEKYFELYQVEEKDKKTQKIIFDKIKSIKSQLKEKMQELPSSIEEIEILIKMIIRSIDENILYSTQPQYTQGEEFNTILLNIKEHLLESIRQAQLMENPNWGVVLDLYEGVNSIPIMTIHKSKGLEFHTVICVDLDDEAWWSFKKNKDEGMSTFFVSFSRAKQRIFYTYCIDKKKIKELHDFLEKKWDIISVNKDLTNEEKITYSL